MTWPTKHRPRRGAKVLYEAHLYPHQGGQYHESAKPWRWSLMRRIDQEWGTEYETVLTSPRYDTREAARDAVTRFQDESLAWGDGTGVPGFDVWDRQRPPTPLTPPNGRR